MMTVISAILAMAKAVPVIDSWVQQLVTLYVTTATARIKKENAELIAKAFATDDQTPIEIAIGNPNPGAHSDAPGTIVVPTLPGVNE